MIVVIKKLENGTEIVTPEPRQWTAHEVKAVLDFHGPREYTLYEAVVLMQIFQIPSRKPEPYEDPFHSIRRY